MQIFFPKEELCELAKSNNFVQRESPINGFNFLLTFTTGLLNTPESTLANLATFLNNTCNINVSPQALDERINEKAKEFLKVCLEKAMKIKTTKIDIPNNLISNFNHIYIIDSTNFDLHPSLKEVFKGSGGSASVSSMRIQFIYDYLSGKMLIEIGDNRTADAPTLFEIISKNKLGTEGNVLFLQDLGYFKTDTFIEMKNNSNFFISKLKFNLNLKDENGQDLILSEILEKNPAFLDLKIKIGNLECRLVGQKIPDNIANERRRKANENAKKKGLQSCKTYSLFLGYSLFITNFSYEFTATSIFTIYRLRWQIELIFKSWKSILKINKIHSARVERILCEVYGKLIMAIILCRIFYSLKFNWNCILSSFKVVQYFKSIALKLADSIVAGFKSFVLFLNKLYPQILRFCKKNKQKNKPSIDCLLLALLPAVIQLLP